MTVENVHYLYVQNKNKSTNKCRL